MVVASHPAVLGSNPGRISFQVEVFFPDFPSSVRRISGNLDHISPWIPFGHHNHKKTIPYPSADGDGLWPQIQYMTIVK